MHGDSKESCLVALIVPDEDVVREWIKKAKLDDIRSFSDACQSSQLREAIFNDIQALSKENRLQGFEIPKAVMLISEAFSLENGLMTPTFKLKRNEVRDRYENELRSLYDEIKTSPAGGTQRSKL